MHDRETMTTPLWVRLRRKGAKVHRVIEESPGGWSYGTACDRWFGQSRVERVDPTPEEFCKRCRKEMG